MEISEECRKSAAYEKNDAYIVIRYFENQMSREELLRRIIKAHGLVSAAPSEDVG